MLTASNLLETVHHILVKASRIVIRLLDITGTMLRASCMMIRLIKCGTMHSASGPLRGVLHAVGIKHSASCMARSLCSQQDYAQCKLDKEKTSIEEHA